MSEGGGCRGSVPCCIRLYSGHRPAFGGDRRVVSRVDEPAPGAVPNGPAIPPSNKKSRSVGGTDRL
jgi:hypothetical protein